MAEEAVPPTLEGRALSLGVKGSYKLIQLLSDKGRTSQVYLAELYKASGTADQLVVKVARDNLTPQMIQGFRGEYQLLLTLREKAGKERADYFPDPKYFSEEVLLDSRNYMVLAEEYVTGAELSEVMKRETDEKLGLRAAIQYAELLEILHATGHFSDDRKPSDVRWCEKDGGHIIVLDWNTVKSGRGGQRNDLHNLGKLWFEIFQELAMTGGDQQSDGRPPTLGASKEWRHLSWGTQTILRKAMGIPELVDSGYRSATLLKQALEKQLARWSEGLDELASRGKREQEDPRERLADLDMAWRRHPPLDAATADDVSTTIKQILADMHRYLIDEAERAIVRDRPDYVGAEDLLIESIILFDKDGREKAESARLWMIARAGKNLGDAAPLKAEAEELVAAAQTLARNEALTPDQERGLDQLKHRLPAVAAVVDLLRAEPDVRRCGAEAGQEMDQRNYRDALDKYRQAYVTFLRLPADTIASYPGWRLVKENLQVDPPVQMQKAARQQATEAEPCELVRQAIESAHIHAWDSAVGALDLAKVWAEDNTGVRELIAQLKTAIDRWRDIESLATGQPMDQGQRQPVQLGQALAELEAWAQSGERKTLLELAAPSAPGASAESARPAPDAWYPGDATAQKLAAWLSEKRVKDKQTDLFRALLAQLDLALALGESEGLTKVCEQLGRCRPIWEHDTTRLAELRQRRDATGRLQQYYKGRMEGVGDRTERSAWDQWIMAHLRMIVTLNELLPLVTAASSLEPPVSNAPTPSAEAPVLETSAATADPIGSVEIS